ncbi:MAG: hypothetical protein CR988_01210 [Treponema sp.]|nr:MAG: hypothetical protein CR988_01210 [Treponema sp.]
MDRNVFITDDRLSFSKDLAEFLRGKEVKVCLTTQPIYDDKKPATTAIEWNRQSPFSLQSLVLQLKKHNMSAETAVVVFDGNEYQKLYEDSDIISLDKSCTDLITANATLTLILKTLFLKQGSGRIVFIHRECPSAKKNTAVSIASAAFVRLAEETALEINKSEQGNVQTLLTKLDGFDDKAYISWIANQMSMQVISRNPTKWIKAGQKSLFG